MGEFDHASWQAAILNRFWQHEREWDIRVMPSLRIKVAATRYRVPDVTVLDREPSHRADHYPPAASGLRGIVSRRQDCSVSSSNWKTTGRWGYQEIWVIDPQDSTFYRYEDLQLRLTNSFSHAEKGFAFDMNELKNLLD